ncbi:MAG: RIP metalloprotease RseP [Opitutales bacterium]
MDWASFFLNIWAIFWMIVFFGGSIFIHELGHFLMAKKRGLKVPKFSIGFGPKLYSWKRGETEYCISLLPLGGYVALPEMGEIPILEGKPSKNSKPLSFMDKFLVAVMGAVFNVLFAFVLACILWATGLRVPEEDCETTIGYILQEHEGKVTPAIQAGLRQGDKILAVDDVAVKSFSEIEKAIILGKGRNGHHQPQAKITFLRDQEVHTAYLDLMMLKTNPLTGDEIRFSGILAPKQKLYVESFERNSSAEKSGLKVGDQILKLNDQALFSFMDLREFLQKYEPQQVNLTVLREGKSFDIICDTQNLANYRSWLHYGTDEQFIDFYQKESDIKILEVRGQHFNTLPEDGRVLSCNGVTIMHLEQLHQLLNQCKERTLMFEIEHKTKQLIVVPHKAGPIEYHPEERITRLGILFGQRYVLKHDNPFVQFKQAIQSTVETLSCLVNKNSDIKMQHLMGAPGIMRLLHRFSIDDFRRLLWFIVLLNINLAILNLLPIPVLDGGHILFALIEKILRRPLPFTWVNAIQNVFVILFLGLMSYVMFFDIRRWQGDIKSDSAQQRMQKLIIPIETQ